MITSIVLINTERAQVADVASKLTDIDGVSEVYSVSGKYDLIAIVRLGKDVDDLAELITGRIGQIDAITHTETMLAFKAFSKHDLQSMFAIGI